MQILDLPMPAELRDRWAACAAVLAAMGYSRGCYADKPLWHYDDGGGNWCDLVHLSNGRAVLLGRDHEYSDTYFREAAAYFQEEETDLLAGAPDWWAEPLAGRDPQDWVGFIYGYDGGRWQRADYEANDGFDAVGLPARSKEAIVEMINEYVVGAAEEADLDYQPSPVALEALLAAGTGLTEQHLAAVFGPVTGDHAAGVAAATRF